MTSLSCVPCSRRAFSLTELLVVIALMGVMLSALIPALSRNRAGELTKDTNDLVALLELAQTYARAHNTAVEVGLRSGAEGLGIVAVDARDGTDLRPLGKARQFAGVRLASVAATPDRPAADFVLADPPADAIPGFDFQGKTYPSVIRFDSRGTARARSDQLSKIVEIGLLPNINGETPDALRKNYGVIQIAGLSGGITVYRP